MTVRLCLKCAILKHRNTTYDRSFNDDRVENNKPENDEITAFDWHTTGYSVESIDKIKRKNVYDIKILTEQRSEKSAFARLIANSNRTQL